MTDILEAASAAGTRRTPGKVRLLPDPEARSRTHVLLSVDDHVIEPPNAFVDRMPARLRDSAPRVVELDDGMQAWEFEDQRLPNIGLSAVVGRAPEDFGAEPTRFDEMRPGCYDASERVKDMDLAGIAASLNFPSMLPGFAGTKFVRTKDPAVGLAAVRAWNDWILEEWVLPYPDRFVPCQITYLADPDLAAEEVRRNAARGFRAVSLPELFEPAGLPSLHTGHWDGLIEACVETGTVVCLHAGSSTTVSRPSSDAPPEIQGALFQINAQLAAADWLYSRLPLRHPELKIVLSEGGVSWVPSLVDRIDRVFALHTNFRGWGALGEIRDITPGEVLLRNFWFCAIDEPSAMGMRHTIGVDRILVEVDYPHADSSWPDPQPLWADRLADVPPAEAEQITWRNASALFRHDLGPWVEHHRGVTT